MNSQRAAFKPLLHFILPEFLLLPLIATPLTRISLLWRFLAFSVYTCIHLDGLTRTTGDAITDLGTGSFLAINIFTAIHFLWLTDPLNDFRHENDRVHPTNMSFFSRIYWALCLRWNFRGAGWNHHNSHIPPLPIQPKWRFVCSTLWKAFKLSLLADLAQSYIHSNVWSKGDKMLDRAAFWLTAYTIISMRYLLVAALVVSLGITEPKHCPDFFGKWGDAYTIRRFWRRTWHPIFARFVTSIGKYLVCLFGFAPGSWGSAYTQLYAAFIISGTIHCAGDMMVDPKYTGNSFPFFILQAVAIMLEDAVIRLARRTTSLQSSNAFTRGVGYIWVVIWFYFTVPGLSWFLQLDLSEALPFSIIRNVGKLFWADASLWQI